MKSESESETPSQAEAAPEPSVDTVHCELVSGAGEYQVGPFRKITNVLTMEDGRIYLKMECGHVKSYTRRQASRNRVADRKTSQCRECDPAVAAMEAL